MKVAVVGLGIFGKSVAVGLARAGAEVIAIDSNIDLVDDVKDEVALAVKLDATDERELRSQGVHEVDALISSIGEHVEANQLVVILAKKLRIPRVIARALSPIHERILRLIGADEVIMPEVEAAEELARRMIQPSLKAYFQLVEGFSVVEINAPDSFSGRSLIDLNLKQRFRVNLIAIKRADPKEVGRMELNAVPLGTDIILAGDVLALAGRDADIRALVDSSII